MSKNKTANTNEEKKVVYTTVGTVKTIVLAKDAGAFTLEPISAYRFLTKDDDDSSWKIILKEDKKTSGENTDKKETKDELPRLELAAQDAKFTVKTKMVDALMALKQNKTRIEIAVESVSGMDGKDFEVSQITVR